MLIRNLLCWRIRGCICAIAFLGMPASSSPFNDPSCSLGSKSIKLKEMLSMGLIEKVKRGIKSLHWRLKVWNKCPIYEICPFKDDELFEIFYCLNGMYARCIIYEKYRRGERPMEVFERCKRGEESWEIPAGKLNVL